MTKRFTEVECAKVDHVDFRARRDATVWQQLNRILLVLLVVAFWLGIITLFVPPYKRLTKSRSEIDQLQAQSSEQKNLLARQTRQVYLLKTDATYLETIARDRLDLMKEGETSCRRASPTKRGATVSRGRSGAHRSRPGSAGCQPAGLKARPLLHPRYGSSLLRPRCNGESEITCAKDVAGKLPATAGWQPALPNSGSEIRVRDRETRPPALETSALPRF